MNNYNPLQNLISDGGLTAIFRTLGCIGDSLASGEHESLDENGKVGYNDYYEYSWGQFIARKCGLTAYNFSRGGLKAKTFFVLDEERKWLTKENACQGYIIALGVNDSSYMDETYSEGFGSIEDVDFNDYHNNKDSFVGWYCRIIQKVREIEPKARIFVVTMPQIEGLDEKRATNRKKHHEFLLSLNKYFEFIYVIDLYEHDEIHNKEYSKKYNCGGHLSAIGYYHIAEQFWTYIDYIIRNNIDDFKQVGFIGKGIYNIKEKW